MKKFFVVALAALLLAAAPAGEHSRDDGDVERELGSRKLTVDDIPTRIADAEVGEWVLYKMPDGSRSRLTVVEKWKTETDTFLVVRNQVNKPKKRRGTVTEEKISVAEAIRELRESSREDLITEADVLVQGERIRAVVVNHYDPNGDLVRQSYFSDRIPVHGLLRGVSPKSKAPNTLTVVDFGFADDGDDDDE